MISTGSMPTGYRAVSATFWVGLSLAAVACGLTLLFLSMRSVMEIGGSCAEGGPYVARQPCPDGVPLAMVSGIFGGLIAFGVYVVSVIRFHVPGFVGLAWPALFLSLGWNFLEFGLDAPGGGLAWGWLVCAIVFGLMGGLPLLIVLPLTLRAFFRGRPQAPPAWAVPQRPATQRAPTPNDGRRARAAADLLRTLSARAAELSRARIPQGVSAAVTKPSAGSTDDLVQRLEALAALHRQGDLSDDEFARAKQRLIEGDQ